MLKWAVVFALIAAVAGGFGFAGVAGAAIGVAKFLFLAALALAIILMALVLLPRRQGLRTKSAGLKNSRRIDA